MRDTLGVYLGDLTPEQACSHCVCLHCSAGYSGDAKRSDMNKTLPVSVRLRPELNNQIAAIASSLDRSKSWVIEQAIKDYVDLQAWQLEAVDQGLREADEGNLIPHDELAAWARSLGRSKDLPEPK